jgi:DNA-binding NarL/FixJ family response regulator
VILASPELVAPNPISITRTIPLSSPEASTLSDLMTTVPMPVAMKSLLICDERASARQTLAELLAQGSSSLVVRTVATGVAVVDAFSARPADLVLIGVHQGNSSGLRAVELLFEAHPGAQVVAFGAPSDSALLIDAVNHGVRGIMLWDIRHQARSTPNFLPAAVGSDNPTTSPAGRILTERELRILRGMCQGHSNKQIGRALFLSEDTIKTDARRMFTKLGARDRAHAVALGMRRGLLN